MFGIADCGAFVVAIIVFLLIPGPGNLALVTSTSKGGIAGGLAATLGVILGDQVLMWSAVAGVAALSLALVLGNEFGRETFIVSSVIPYQAVALAHFAEHAA